MHGLLNGAFCISRERRGKEAEKRCGTSTEARVCCRPGCANRTPIQQRCTATETCSGDELYGFLELDWDKGLYCDLVAYSSEALNIVLDCWAILTLNLFL